MLGQIMRRRQGPVRAAATQQLGAARAQVLDRGRSQAAEPLQAGNRAAADEPESVVLDLMNPA
jgi:hypothetical protein